MTRKDILERVGNIAQIASIKPYRMTDGKADGMRVFDVSTGSGLEFTVIEDKCLDISNIKFKGINLNFMSKPGLAAPQYFSPRGTEFYRTFQGGMLYTCGLTNVGDPCCDNGEEYGAHGRISHVPASNVAINADWTGDEYIMEISGEMREAALFGENLVLKRKICTKLGSGSIKIHNEIENQGFEEQALMVLLHINIGYPLLDACTKIEIPSMEVTPKDEEAAEGIDCYNTFTAPMDGFKEQVFYHQVKTEHYGNVSLKVLNSKLGIGTGKLLWRIADKRERGTLKKIRPLEKIDMDLELGVFEI